MATFLDLVNGNGGAVPALYEPRIVRQGDALYFQCKCRRLVTFDMMVDLDAMPAPDRLPPAARAVYAGRRKSASDTRRFMCDACWTGLVRTGQIDRNDWRRAIGAPPLPASSRKPW